jgi:hypothetical protein
MCPCEASSSSVWNIYLQTSLKSLKYHRVAHTVHNHWQVQISLWSISGYHIVMCMRDFRWGFGLDNGCIDHLNILLIITLNYSVIAHFHTLRNHTKSLPAHSVFTSSFLVTTSNSIYSSASIVNSSLNGDSLRNAFTLASVILTPLHGRSRKHCFWQHL